MGNVFAPAWQLADRNSLAVVGAAAVLGAACRAPLTAVALMVEITRWVGLHVAEHCCVCGCAAVCPAGGRVL